MQRLFALIALGVMVALGAATAGCARRAVAKVNGAAITEREFHDRLETYAGPQTLDRLILEKLVAQAAKRKGVEVSDAEVGQVEQNMRKMIGEGWADYLRMKGQTEEDIERDIRMQLLVARLAIPAKDVKAYWEQNRTHFDVPTTVKYRRVILKSKSEAEKARQAITAGKLSFAQALKTMSVPEDPMAKQGGEVPSAQLGYGDPVVEKALSALPLHQLGEPLAAAFPQNAYQLVEVLARTPGRKVSFAKASGSVLLEMATTRQQEIADFLRDLRVRAGITIFPKRYKTLAEQYAKLKEQAPPKIEMPGAPPRPRPVAPAGAPR